MVQLSTADDTRNGWSQSIARNHYDTASFIDAEFPQIDGVDRIGFIADSSFSMELTHNVDCDEYHVVGGCVYREFACHDILELCPQWISTKETMETVQVALPRTGIDFIIGWIQWTKWNGNEEVST